MKLISTYFTSLFILLSVLLTSKINAQSYIFNPGIVFNMVVGTNQSNFDGIEVQNIGTQNLNLSWRLLSVDTLIDSRFELCNSGICFMNLPISGNMPTITPGSNGWIKFHIISGLATGLNTIKYVVKNGTIQKDTLTFYITVSDATGVNELINRKDNITLFPNPTQNNTNVNLTLTESSEVTLTALNALGQTVNKSVSNYSSGSHTINLDTENWASGIYNINISTINGTTNRKLVIAR